jgi:hypothetical protein
MFTPSRRGKNPPLLPSINPLQLPSAFKHPLLKVIKTAGAAMALMAIISGRRPSSPYKSTSRDPAVAPFALSCAPTPSPHLYTRRHHGPPPLTVAAEVRPSTASVAFSPSPSDPYKAPSRPPPPAPLPRLLPPRAQHGPRRSRRSISSTGALPSPPSPW